MGSNFSEFIFHSNSASFFLKFLWIFRGFQFSLNFCGNFQCSGTVWASSRDSSEKLLGITKDILKPVTSTQKIFPGGCVNQLNDNCTKLVFSYQMN